MVKDKLVEEVKMVSRREETKSEKMMVMGHEKAKKSVCPPSVEMGYANLKEKGP
jgi:hypothetical protein